MGELSAGAELDQAVAERVMGLVPCGDWEAINFGSSGGPAVRKRCQHPQGACYPTVANGGIFGVAGGCPRYSTVLAIAWSVVERLQEEQVDVMLFQAGRSEGPGDLVESTDRQWECALWWQENGEHRETTQYADTPAEAICKAAFRWAESRRAGSVGRHR